MKYLRKIFENEKLYHLINDDLRDLDLKYEKLKETEINQILNSLIKPWHKTHGIFLDAKNSTIKLKNVEEDFYVTILKTEDEWFYTILENDIESEVYKCDQFQGVIDLLKFNGVIK